MLIFKLIAVKCIGHEARFLLFFPSSQTVTGVNAITFQIWEESFTLSFLVVCIVPRYGWIYISIFSRESGSRAVSSSLFIRLQGQLDVARPLRLLLGIDLRGERLKGQQNEEGEKGYLNYLKVVAQYTTTDHK